MITYRPLVRCAAALLMLGGVARAAPSPGTPLARLAVTVASSAAPHSGAVLPASAAVGLPLAATTSWWWGVRVTVSPTTASVAAGASQTFKCTVTGSSDTACTWSVKEGAAGGTVTTAGVYTAPNTAGTYHVVAKSHADSTKSASATVTVTASAPAVAVTISPTTASVDACQKYTFTASVTGTTNTAVTWSVSEGSAGGSVSATGVYTAPATAGTYHVVATSQADPSKSRSATVTVAAERVLSVAVNPSSATVAPGGTVQLTATVTTTCGAFTQTQAVAATGATTN